MVRIDPKPGIDRARVRSIAPLRALWPFLKPYRAQILGATLCLAIAAVTVLALGQGLKALIDRGFGTGEAAMLDRAVLLLLAVVLVLAASTYGRYYLVTWLGERVVADLRRAVFDRVLALEPGWFEEVRTAEVISRLTTDTTVLQALVGGSVSVALRNLLLFLGGTALMFVTDARLTGLVFLVVPLVLLPILLFGRRVRRLSRESQDRIAELGSYIDESLHGIRTVQAFTHEAVDRIRLGEYVESAFMVAVRRTRARALLTAAVIALVFGAVSIVLWLGGHDVVSGRISPGDLSAFVFYAIVVAGSVGALSEVAGDVQRAAGAMERLSELLTTRPRISAPDRPVSLPEPARGAVEFVEVSFRYPSRPERPALHRVSFRIAPGERVALVGPSGAGKTTVLQLILRFYDADSGRILFDGVELRQADPKAVRARIGLVAQEPTIFAADVAENILYGRPEADKAMVRAAAEAAYATEFIDRLPAGMATQLGERGVRLSGGQRQRIAIARAILRNPALLLLDEATSALDAESERLVQAALDRLMADRTTLVIAHRLATVLMADRILVMDRGAIVECGRHEELVRAGGLYARLAALQFNSDAMSQPENRSGLTSVI
ncbi:MAG TPA: ABC transporter transmembrane domain-containing protein [Alphaproteobacteria bacterium]|nr:ABC transporter transmembrane domain-containing protein [Alphaproteobacteria bacterium]